MIRKFIFIGIVGSFILTTSCKKQEEMTVSTANDNGVEQQEAIVTPEAANAAVQMPETAVALPANGKYPVMEFEKREHDFGSINAGEKVSYNFIFKNTGDSDLLITSAAGSCGCTVPDYPKDPIKPGESGKIHVSFNSEGRNGNQQKSVTIVTNTQSGKELLQIKAQVKTKV